MLTNIDEILDWTPLCFDMRDEGSPDDMRSSSSRSTSDSDRGIVAAGVCLP